MQNIHIEKPYKFVPPIKRRWPHWLLVRSGLLEWTLRKKEGVIEHEIRHLDRLKASVEAGHGIMLAPNHPRTADPMVMQFVSRALRCPFYLMASWHLFNQSSLRRLVIRCMGAFSVNREGLDRQSIDEAIEILQTAERPLLIFPEGTTSRTNDKLMTFMEGPAFIGRTAARRRAKGDGGKVVCHPIAIKYVFAGDIETVADEVLSDIEHKLTWRQLKDAPLIDRLVKVGDALLTLKELEFGVKSKPADSLRQRQTGLVNHLLEPLEREWLDGPRREDGIALRVKNLSMKIFPEMSRNQLAEAETLRRRTQLQDIYLSQQIDSYPDQYVVEFPTVDRILETLEKFEEDLTDQARVHGLLKAIVEIGEPIEFSAKRDRDQDEDLHLVAMRQQIEAMLQELRSESRLYVGSSLTSMESQPVSARANPSTTKEQL